MRLVTVLMGIPGSGKSTWAAQQRGAIVLSADSIRTHGDEAGAAMARLRGKLAYALSHGAEWVVIDTCSLIAADRLRYKRAARQAGYAVELVVVTTPLATARRRDRLRPQPMTTTYDWQAAERQLRAAHRVISSERWDRVHYVPEA